MINPTTKNLKLLTKEGICELVRVDRYESTKAMCEALKDPEYQLTDNWLNIDPKAFTPNPHGFGTWLQLPPPPAPTKMIYFLQDDRSVTLYKISSKVNYADALNKNGYVKY